MCGPDQRPPQQHEKDPELIGVVPKPGKVDGLHGNVHRNAPGQQHRAKAAAEAQVLQKFVLVRVSAAADALGQHEGHGLVAADGTGENASDRGAKIAAQAHFSAGALKAGGGVGALQNAGQRAGGEHH